jgi:hypothetical protein
MAILQEKPHCASVGARWVVRPWSASRWTGASHPVFRLSFHITQVAVHFARLIITPVTHVETIFSAVPLFSRVSR